jgi:WS/DGAT/MGAT family acyltransferase
MIDGASGVELSQLLLSLEPKQQIGVAPRFIPRPEPSDAELKADERQRRLLSPVELAGDVVRFARDHTEDLGGAVVDRARALAGLASWKAVPASETPVNGRVGPHRIVDWVSIPLDDMKTVRRALDCKINDVVLTLVTGAFRNLMRRRQVRPDEPDFRVSAPVNVRKPGESATEPGNRVSSWIVRLPLAEEDPLAQLASIREETRRRKEDGEADAVELVMSLVDRLGISVQDMSVGTVNTIVTNVPGPPFPLYLLGAEAEEMIPLAPLLDNIGISIGALSYNGRVAFGLSADYDRLPDLPEFCNDLVSSFERLADAAGVVLQRARVAIEAGERGDAGQPDAAEAVEATTVEPPPVVRH